MSYQALYRKWRPRTFSEVVGQEHITETLRRQIAAGRFSHAYLFTGTRGTGKTSCAKILAKAINCEHPVDGDPCNECPSCRGIDSGAILDVEELDAASNNGVDHIRALREEAAYTPASVRTRVYIVDEVHMLTTAAFNALLKTLEEPPAHLVFVLATTELHKVPATILSRCQRYAFRRISASGIAGRMSMVSQAEGIDLTTGALNLLSRLGDGSMRDALSLLDQCVTEGPVDEERVYSVVGLAGMKNTAELISCAARGDAGTALELFGGMYDAGKDVSYMLDELASLCRDLLLLRVAPKGGPALISGLYDNALLTRLDGECTTDWLTYALSLLQKTQLDLAVSYNKRTEAELCLIRLSAPEAVSGGMDAVRARLAAVEKQLSEGTPWACAIAAERADAPGRSAPAVETTLKAADPPPWDTEPEAAPEKPAAETVARSAPEQSRAEIEPAAAARDGVFDWAALLKGLEGTLDPMAYSFLNMDGVCAASLSGGVLTLSFQNDTVHHIISTDEAVLKAISDAAKRMCGTDVELRAIVGKAPEDKLKNLDVFGGIVEYID